jgi:hypothetical protein
MESAPSRGEHVGVDMCGLRRAGAGLALVVVVLGGCAGGDDPGAGADPAVTGDSSGPTAEQSADATDDSGGNDGDFCSEIAAAGEELQDISEDPDLTDPETALGATEETLETLRSIDPPAEIADDWNLVVSYIEAVADSLRDLDATDPAGMVQQLEELGAELEQQFADFDEAGTRIDQYLRDECGITVE